ncbi:TNF(tumor Necrosis Factor) family [Popillia japonica]|uniref:TNF(Tumor Necrosis Factor) family n=1 Tax=Popillia japonica TaxID=7064 RepID=A0AAW1KSP8_POPJA
MEYRKLTGEGCTSCVTKVFIVFGLVISVILWFVLFFGLYTLNNELALLRSEQEKIICMIRPCSEFNTEDPPEVGNLPEFRTGYAPQDNFGYYDDLNIHDYYEDMEDEPEDKVQLGSSHTKDGLEGVRLKRDIDDGRQINSEAYADVRRKNYGSAQSTTSKSGMIYRRIPHRRPAKPSMLRSFSSNSPDQDVSPDMLVIQGLPHKTRHRQRRVGSSFLRPAIHMYGEVTSSNPNYENHIGNGRMHHYNSHFKNWTKENWVQNLGMDDYFELSDGYLKFLDSGLYYIYAQIYYIDEHDTNGFGIYKNNELILQCTTTSHSNHRVTKPNTCYTGGVIAFSNGDVLKVHDIDESRYSIFQKGKSFFGAIKLGEIRET